MPGFKITAMENGVLRTWITTGAIDETSSPGWEKFTGHRLNETTDGSMKIQDSKLTDKKVEPNPSP